MQTLKDLLNGNAERYANKPAFLGAHRNYTFREVNERINCLNHALVSLGVRKGDRVGILAYNCPQCFEVFGLAK